MKTELEALYQGESLSQAQCRVLFTQIVSGNVDDITLSSLLTALKIKGETPAEIAGAAGALIDNAAPFPRPDYPFADIVGTGGDGHNTINISSTAAIVAASCGIKVAKHGNRSVSSRSGSADLFKAFGLNLTMSADKARECLDESGLCFLFAPNYHGGIKHAMPVRTTLKTRTLFNLLGPLVNPASPSHILVGVYSPELLMPFAETLKLLGYQNAMVVHGSGLDELALHGPSDIVEIKQGEIHQYQVTPADFGLESATLKAIEGGEPEENKHMIEQVLKGQGQKAHTDAIAMNTAALLKLTGQAPDFKSACDMALECIQSGQALETLRQCAELSGKE